MIHVIINKQDGQIWYEGIDKADACNQMKPSFMSWIEAGKEMKDFPLYYEAMPEKEPIEEYNGDESDKFLQ